MENFDFDQLALQYQPMIHKLIRSLNIYKNQKEFYQTALIALWEAQRCFDPRKGDFPSYAYMYIRGKMLSEMTFENKNKERSVYPEEEYWGAIEDQKASLPLEADQLLSYCDQLTVKEKKWVLAYFLEGLSTEELAARENVTISAVKHWRVSALKKLRGQTKL
ncbi:sigma-70 family RNA polymerase sigma factor [Bacillus sp. MRMR6]|uniref:sigma-70 family RNA polymerase sigma factor n=1 Tax=Bacillus sp. MRMR6 TaxID=1928617 RepID=UPI000951BDB4|nr:sigma-70 family RNA polymerase sigma factor [Bacillus sp. MRMR6]OLS39989.1 RNA polymerase subunit sigma-24 [Bacillus sp. MRMR6]